MYAEVIIDITIEQLDHAFTYRIPDRYLQEITVGSRVLVPFGRGNIQKKGYVVNLVETCSYPPEMVKEILSPVKGAASAQERSFELAAFLKRNFGGTMSQALKVVVPAKAKVAMKQQRTILRQMDREQLLSLLGEAGRKHQGAKVKLLEALLEQEQIPYEWVTGKLGVTAATIHSLEKAGALSVLVSEGYRNPVQVKNTSTMRPKLSEEQDKIVSEITADLQQNPAGEYLIYGITGSGKTEVYMSIVEDVVARGKQVIFLIPEIALTYQTLMRFYGRFGDRVSVLHSGLSAGEKYDQCQRAKAGEIDIIIGPRSALFTPFPNLGLIIMDEEHESSYKSEVTPKYHAREVARELARISGAGLVLGSATPSLSSYYRGEQGKLKVYRLTKRLTGGALPSVEVVDLRKELREGNRSIFSRRLQELLADRLEKGQQSMLFLNRRGYAGFISCRACGEVMKCPHCEVSLSEHYGNKLVCHYCGYETIKPAKCPSCGSKYISGFKAGTEKIEEELCKLYPGVRVLRMDKDTTRTKDSYEDILSRFASGEAQVLVGTQMIVKGHDFPGVTLVGILAADLSLGADDFCAGERTFQLLTQAVGRAGRGKLPGEAILQTYQPDHYAVNFAAEQNYEGFYRQEILYRTLTGYPPVGHMLAVQVFGPTEPNVEKIAETLARKMEGREQLKLLGPTPGGVRKVKDIYRYVLYIKATAYETLVLAKDELEQLVLQMNLRQEYVQFDFDPMNSL